MRSLRSLLLATAALSLLATGPALADPAEVLLAQAEEQPEQPEVITDPVVLAEMAVEEARVALRSAMASGRGIAAARQALRDAIRALEDARVAAGLPPEDESTEGGAAPPSPEPTDVPPEDQPPLTDVPPTTELPAPPVEVPPPPEATEPPAVVETPPPPAQDLPPAIDELPAPPAELPPPPPSADSAPQIESPDAPSGSETPPPDVAPTDTQPAEPAEAAPPPVVDLPPPVVVEPPPPPPPAATEGDFSLENFDERPNFGEAPPEPTAAPALPEAASAVREGQTLAAPDGRVIVKNQGQVTIVHDDTGRFVRRGDQSRTERTANNTETTTVTRPNGTEIVTVRDQWGNIVQRYRKNADGSVEVLIGAVEDPGLVGRIFGQGAQPAPPPPPQPPASLNLEFGPLVLEIPEQQYIVESSRANQQQLEQALVAPPVETVERAYTLEEIRRSGRLRDKVRRIDFDTITFNTNEATIPDSQIAQMEAIGFAMRDVIENDPTQVFLVEGHTDAVGSDLYNLALSDRRAETVAQILSYYFGIPPENLVTQGYGEQYLKIPTVAAERQNRRVAFRNITYLLRAGG
jgi:outer membrane protein OmpA-like peptidoglycan-associated protein